MTREEAWAYYQDYRDGFLTTYELAVILIAEIEELNNKIKNLEEE